MELDAEKDGGLDISSLEITPEILSLIAELDEFKGAWRAIGRIEPERLLSLRRLATIESVGSSTRIEGARLSNREIERLLSNLQTHVLATRDEQEVAGYAEVMDMVLASWEAIALTENHIKQLHRDLLKYSPKDARHRGAYKTLPNHVEAFGPDGESLGIIMTATMPFDTPRRMAELVTWTVQHLESRRLHPLLVIAIFVVVFLEIHPFQDGNGRLSRILTTLLLLRAGYGYVSYSSLERVIEESKEAYYLALRQTQETIPTVPNWEPWVRFFLRALQRQKQRLDKKLERERLLFGGLPELSVQILDLTRTHGRVTVAGIVKATNANRNTVKDHVKALVERGDRTRHGAGRGTWYGP